MRRRLQQAAAGNQIHASPTLARVPYAGVHMIWGPDSYAASSPFIMGGQTQVDWTDVEPTQGNYDWSGLLAELKTYHNMGKPTTIWLNSPVKPSWVYNLPDMRKVGTYTKGGNTWDIITYWKPAFMNAMAALLNSLGQAIRTSPYADSVLGLRGTPNCIGTEQYDLTDPQATITDSTVWNEWTRALGIQCYADIMRMHNAALNPTHHAFLRSVLFTGLDTTPALRTEMISEQTGWLHAVNPDPDSPVTNVDTFYYNWVKSGKTRGYYEALPAAGNKHPLSWVYWRYLHDLNRGIAYVVSYDDDLVLANDGASQQPEYRAIYDFANTYAGYHDANSAIAPGAWIAFRGGASTQLNNGNYLTLYNADGSVGGDTSTVALDSNKGASIIGPTSQRFGRYARRTDVASGKTSFYLRLQPVFRQSLSGTTTVRVTYLDAGTSTWKLSWNGGSSTVTKTGTGNWLTKSISVPASGYAGSLAVSSDLILSVTSADTTFHMVEIVRS